MSPVRVLIAAALALTGHAGASALIAILTVAGWVLRTLLPVLPQVMAVSVGVAIAALVLLTARELLGHPLFRPAAVTR